MKEYKNLIRRKIALLTEKKNMQERQRRMRFSFFSDIKRKEIIVWMWLNGNKDKDQIKELVMDRFNVSEQDAEAIFYEAYPDGLDLQEDEMLDDLNNVLKRTVNMQPQVVSDTIDSMTGKIPEITLNQYNISPTVEKQIKVVVGFILKNRGISKI